MLSFSSGLFIVPLYTYLQIEAKEKERSRVIAANNIVNAISMVVGSVLVMILMQLHVTIATVFLVIALCNAVAAVLFWLTLKSIAQPVPNWKKISIES